jgi:outer membrane protein assembly factor BamB
MELARFGLLFANADQRLVLLDGQSGQVIWETSYTGSADSLATDAERAYLTSDWRINAYSPADGQLLWQTDQQTTRRWYGLYLRDGFLFEYQMPFRGQDIIYKFDPETGLKLEAQVNPLEEGAPFFYIPLGEDIDLRRGGKALWAIERGTGRTLWHIPIGDLDTVATPALANDLLVITSGSDLLVLGLYTGEVLWRAPEVLSNPVVLGSTVYVIAVDGSIRAYELSSGRAFGFLKVEPSVTLNQYTYGMLANEIDGMIYAYYGDSQELIAFGR